MKILFLTIFLSFLSLESFGQMVGKKEPIIRLKDYNIITDDGIITFEIDVRMSDCLDYLELNDMTKRKKDKTFWDKLYEWWWFKVLKIYNFEISKTLHKKLTIDNYFLLDSDDDQEHIVMRTDIIPLKSLFGRKLKKKVQINLFSMTGKCVYSKEFILNKNKLIEKSY
jgi:hypothetical protein